MEATAHHTNWEERKSLLLPRKKILALLKVIEQCAKVTKTANKVLGIIKWSYDGFAGLRRPDAATRSWLEDLNIEI